MHITIYPRVDIKILLTYVKCPLVQQYRHPRSNTHTHARNRRDVAQSTAISKRLFPASTLYMEQRNDGRPLNVGTVATSSLPLPIHPSIHPTIHPSIRQSTFSTRDAVYQRPSAAPPPSGRHSS